MKTKTAIRASLSLVPLLLLASAVPGAGQSAPLYMVEADSAVSEAALRGAIDAIFDADDMGDTRALLVLHDGKIVAERYAPQFGPDTKQLSWSMAKTITAVLIGLMVSDGRLALDSPAPVPAWNQAGDPRGAITLRQLLTMSSGLAHAESAEDAGGAIAATDTARMLFTDGAGDMAGYAEAKPLAEHPGARFNYSSATSVILSDILTRMLTDSSDPETRRAAMMQFIEGRLKQPVGLGSLTPEFDARGTMIGGSIMHMTARDYAKFGEFLRTRGRANGRQILSQRWVDFMTSPSEREPAYGGHIWLNRDSENSALFQGIGPKSLFGCVGHNGQYILVSPRQRLTIVRLGVSDSEQRVPLRKALGRLVELFPG
ncbi:serine hydrolase domain-containing protein [Sphingobium algorifonticola]|nr:serine hydrolase [Sphingobium algorifonticola]